VVQRTRWLLVNARQRLPVLGEVLIGGVHRSGVKLQLGSCRVFSCSWITDYFCSADTTNDGQLDFQEIWSLLQRMSVNITKEEALMKFNVSNGLLVLSESTAILSSTAVLQYYQK